MRTPAFFSALWGAALCTCWAAAAQTDSLEPAAPLRGQALTLDEALTLLHTENPALQAAARAEEAALQLRRAAVGLRMPQISLSAAFVDLSENVGFDLNRWKAPVREIGGKVLPLLPDVVRPEVTGAIDRFTAGNWFLKLQDRDFGGLNAEVTLPIWLGGKIRAANRVARINEQEAHEATRSRRDALVSELVGRYFGLALARQVVRVRERVVAGMRRHLSDAEALERNGMLARSERLYVAFKLAEAERDLSDARLRQQTVAAALNGTLGRTGRWEPVTAMFLVDRLAPLDDFRQRADDRNPLLQQVVLKRQLAEEALKVKRAEFLPQVAAVGGARLCDYQLTELAPRWMVGVGVRLRLFDGLRSERTYSAARATVRQVEALQSEAREGIAVLVEQRYNEVANCRSRMRSIEASIAFADAYLQTKQAAFREGMATAADLIDAELQLAAAQTERLENAYNYDCSLALLLEAAGLSGEFAGYARRPDAQAIRYEQP